MVFLVRSMALCATLCCAWTVALAAEPKDPSFESFRELLLREKPGSVAEALQAVRQPFPSYLSHHTLVHHSISLHGSDYESPRVIVFGDTAEFVITFNGDPKLRGYGSIEVMQFSSARGFEFRAISFRREPKNEAELLDREEIETQTETFQISRANPRICMGCHDEHDPRPIWEPFAVWPGVYGSADDRLFRFLFDSGGRPLPSAEASAPGLAGADAEMDGFVRYLAGKPRNARYKLLPFPRGLDIRGFDDTPTPDAENRPNLTLTRLLSIQAAKLIGRDAGAEPNGRGKLLLLAATECLRRSPPPGPPPVALKAIVAGAEGWRRTFRRDIAAQAERDLNRMRDYFGRDLRMTTDSEIGEDQTWRPQWLLASALDRIGLNIRKYSFNMNRVNSYQDGEGGFFALGSILRAMLQDRLQLDHVPSCAEVYGALEAER